MIVNLITVEITLECLLFTCLFFSEMSRKEHLTRQKQLLNKTLGLEGGIGLASVGGEELFKEEDLILESSSVHDSFPLVFDVYACRYHSVDVY